MIVSFRCDETKAIFNQERSRKFQAIEKTALRKLRQLHRAKELSDLLLPGNRLEALRGDREGQYSIRVNDQYRLCFTWEEIGASNVEIVDYH